MGAEIDRPEERVCCWVCRVREADEVNGHVPNHPVCVQDSGDRLRQLYQVDRGQARLREEAAAVDVLGGLYTVEGANQPRLTIWLNEEGDRGHGELGGCARWSSLDDSADFAESPDVILPASVEARHSNLCFLRHDLDHDFLQFFDDGLCHRDLPLPQFHHGLDPVHLEAGVAPSAELVVNLEDPGVYVELVGDKLRE